MPEPIDILLTQRFLPEHGGSIRWMYEVYRQWPRPVRVITHDYFDHPPGTPEFPHRPVRPPAGDVVTDANLIMDRRDIFLRDWGLERPSQVCKYLRMTRAVGQVIRTHPGRTIQVHCVHAVPEVASLLPLRWRYGRRLRIICYVHGEEVTACNSSRQLRWLMRRSYSAADVLIVNSRYTAGVLGPHAPADKVQVIHPGVNLSEFANADTEGKLWRQRRGLGGKQVIVTVGRLDPRKNHAAVIRAVAQLRHRFPNLAYLIAGQGRYEQALRELTTQLQVADLVTFVGPVDGRDKLGMYGGCDLFAMPAIRDGTDVEGFGMVFLEAGACGKASVAGREGGQAEAVQHEKTGLVVDGTDDPQVTQSIARLLADEPLRNQMGQAGRAYAQQFDWPRVIQRTVELVEAKKTAP